MEPVVIPDWRGHRTFHPEMTAQVAALTEAFQQLQRRGVAVTVTSWERPDP